MGVGTQKNEGEKHKRAKFLIGSIIVLKELKCSINVKKKKTDSGDSASMTEGQTLFTKKIPIDYTSKTYSPLKCIGFSSVISLSVFIRSAFSFLAI